MWVQNWDYHSVDSWVGQWVGLKVAPSVDLWVESSDGLKVGSSVENLVALKVVLTAEPWADLSVESSAC